MRKLLRRSGQPDEQPAPVTRQCGDPAMGGVQMRGEPPPKCQLPEGHDGYHECTDAYDNRVRWKVNIYP